MTTPLLPRQTLSNDPEFVNENGREVPFWWTRTGQIIRTSVFFGIFFLLLAYMTIGYLHAKRRIKKGLPPLRYHRWLLNRETRMRYDPNYQNPAVYYNEYPQGAQYGMHSMPPPMYDPNSQMPPTYQPPMGGSKVDPSQYRTQPTRRPAEGSDSSPEYEAPPGPPPAAAMRPTNTGASTTSNNPYRL